MNELKIPAPILRDLSNEMMERTRKTIYSMTAIVDDPADKTALSIACLSCAIGITSGFVASQIGGIKPPDVYDVAEAVLGILRDAGSSKRPLEIGDLVERTKGRLKP